MLCCWIYSLFSLASAYLFLPAQFAYMGEITTPSKCGARVGDGGGQGGHLPAPPSFQSIANVVRGLGGEGRWGHLPAPPSFQMWCTGGGGGRGDTCLPRPHFNPSHDGVTHHM